MKSWSEGMSQTLFMETTKIDAGTTVGQIQNVLGKYGATQILTDYEEGEVSAVSFCIQVGKNKVPFRLPCRWKAVHTVMINRKSKPRENREGEYILQAKRVAWRQILRWIEAQLALVETQMVRIEEVFMPYLVVDKKGTTLYQQISGNNFLLDAPKP